MVVGLALALGGCTTIRDTKGPDGETAHIVHCQASDSCYEAAAEQCPEGYVLRSTAISARSGSEILVSCKNDVPSAR
jgi:hypothetical protein